MSMPTQVLPSWLTLSTNVITAPDGSVSTSSTTLRLPLTYYGPSIPLGTDGVWTYGGLTPPPATSTSSSSTPVTTSSLPTSLSLTSSLSSLSHPSTSTASPTSSLTGSAGASSHGLSATKLGAILGAILGTVFLIILILIILLLRRYYHGGKHSEPSTDQSSSFWNRRTTLFSIQRQSRRQTPIWTEWQMVSPDDFNDDANAGMQSPGEGSPRGSGEEEDPFLTRSLRSTANEMLQTKTGTDTLVSMPAAAAIAGGTLSTHQSATKFGGPIMPRDELLSRMNEEEATMPTVRVVDTSPEDHTMPLPPPPPIGSIQRGFRPTRSSHSFGSIGMSEKSVPSIPESPGPETAEFLTARRVKLGLEPGESEPGTSLWTGGPSGLERLANLPRMSWFRRMSFLNSPRSSRDAPNLIASPPRDDRYTRTPPRAHSRQRSSSSRPVSWAPLPTQEPSSPVSSMGRGPRSQSGLRAELGMRDERPISTLSSRSRTTTASGNTMYHDARSTPGSSQVDVTSPVGTFGSGGSRAPPVPPLPASQRSQALPTRQISGGGYESVPREPPSYEASMLAVRLSDTPSSELDVLDDPAPRPASPFTAVSGRPSIPPGLVPLPTPDAWRNSRVTDMSVGTSGIQIDVLEDEPPIAQDGWRSLAGGEGRRMTFGVPMVVHPRDALNSEQASLHSMRSHLSPRSGLSPSGSAPASSRHTMHSSSSRPSIHSQGLTASSGMSLTHSSSLSDDDRRPRRRAGVGEIGSPPVSAVFSREGPWESRSRSPLAHVPGMPHLPPIRQSPSSSNAEIPPPYVASGTLTSVVTARTEDSHTNSSVTTTLTDPITGAVLHFPALPWGGVQDNGWENARHNDNEMW